MKSRLFYLLAIFLFLPVYSSFAQVSKGGSPWSLENHFAIKAASIADFPDAPKSWEMDLIETMGDEMKPFLFAWPVDTSINILNAQNRIYSDNLTDIYQLVIRNTTAYSINLIFSQYHLPRGAELFLYNPDYSVIRGAYTDQNNKEYRKLATTPVPGNQIIVELIVDKTKMEFEPILEIGRVSFDMKDVFSEKAGHFGRSGDCNVDINCPAGAEWQLEKQSVAKFIRGGSFLCSGALINNTANDGTAYFLTAHHCIQSGLHARLSVFYFNYESPTCLGGNGSAEQSISGSNLMATSSKLDFALVTLTVKPPESYSPYYAGWDRNPVSFYDTVTCIHHPSGDVKKISVSNRRIATGDFGANFDKNTHWHIAAWDIGTTEGGSSGSPLFNNDHKIIGDLTGGDAACSYNYNDYFQKLWLSWDKYPDISEQLKHWLDPEGNGSMVWNGYDPFSQGEPVANFSRRPHTPVVGKYLRLIDETTGSPISWNWDFPDGNPSASTERNPVVYYETPGVKTIRLIVVNDLGTDTIQQSLIIENTIDFSASQRRLVKGSSTNYNLNIIGDYINKEWLLTEGVVSWRSFDESFAYEYLQPGKHSTMLTVNYDGEQKKLFHQNYINVVPEEIIFSGHLMSAYDSRESIGVFNVGENGTIPGTNELGYSAFANEFTNFSDTTLLIYGIQVDVLNFENQGQDVYLSGALWDSEWNEVRLDSIKLNAKSIPFRTTIWFDQALGLDSTIYGGFMVPEKEDLVFSAGMSLTRDKDDGNSAWGKIDNTWQPFRQGIGLNSAISASLEVASIHQDFNEQIKVETISQDQIRINLESIVFKRFEMDIFDMSGKKIRNTSNHNGQYIDIEFLNPVSGVYLINLRLDNISFTKKVILLRK